MPLSCSCLNVLMLRGPFSVLCMEPAVLAFLIKRQATVHFLKHQSKASSIFTQHSEDWSEYFEIHSSYELWLASSCKEKKMILPLMESIRKLASIELEGISQNHRMVGVGRDLCGSSSPTLLPKQGHPERAAQDLVQAGLEYLQRRRLHSLPGQPVPVLRHPQSEEVLPHVQLELPML